ncbi:hypothetical protein C2G38_2202648 [Gigaspora rosea]|uniref:Uncharacterized protein n=1 Tax=Gigaspora rosea TaxID=44941 RepID=A0A397USI4_9GLOM|nr:hypothetical protein C2G38_2202648 [Gigaspora rosea]
MPLRLNDYFWARFVIPFSESVRTTQRLASEYMVESEQLTELLEGLGGQRNSRPVVLSAPWELACVDIIVISFFV